MTEKKSDKDFTVKNHNSMIETIDGIVKQIKEYNDDNLELNNAVKSLLDACTRLTAYYTHTNKIEQAPIPETPTKLETFKP
ncbi:unnamed protein product [marine sediment metagenome]|uniref:Uncharacterized protein n=1 Tax=marine sediment metagenome TaxID=412755 RepID=X0S3Z7_9ZZZZ